MGREVSRLAKSARGKNEMEDERSKSVGIMRLAMRALMGSDRRERSEKATKGGSREREDVTGISLEWFSQTVPMSRDVGFGEKRFCRVKPQNPLLK